MSEILTIKDVVALGTISEAAARTEKVARLVDGVVRYGTARSIGDEKGNFLGTTIDVRDGFLRVTTKSGFEAFWPVRDLMEEVHTGIFAPYDWS